MKVVIEGRPSKLRIKLSFQVTFLLKSTIFGRHGPQTVYFCAEIHETVVREFVGTQTGSPILYVCAIRVFNYNYVVS